MVDMNPDVLISRLRGLAFLHTVLSMVPPPPPLSAGFWDWTLGQREGAGMSGQCVPFISVSPVASTAPGTGRLSINVCKVEARE